jgi:hypothetical protein
LERHGDRWLCRFRVRSSHASNCGPQSWENHIASRKPPKLTTWLCRSCWLTRGGLICFGARHCFSDRSLRIVGYSYTTPARADETACLYAGQDYSLGAAICAGSRVAIECHAPYKGGKDAYWTKEHSEDCQAAPKTQ